MPVLTGLAAGLAVCTGLSANQYAEAQSANIPQAATPVAQEAPAPKPPIEGRIVSRVVKDVRPIPELYHKAASQTPSGFKVPRYVSLKKGKVYGRTGPSRNHQIAWEYRRKGLPLIIVAETELWRKVRDYRGDESWVHKSMLTGESHVLVIRETSLRKKPREASNVVAIAQAETILKLDRCEEIYCKVESKDGYEGWIRRTTIWGTEQFD